MEARPGTHMRMAQRVHNVVTGETITFQPAEAPARPDGLEFDLELRPLGMPGGLPHRHLPAERFEVLSGRLIALIAGRAPVDAGPGEVFEVPPRRWHVIMALKPTRARVRVSPAMRFAELLACQAEIGSGHIRPGTLRRLNQLLAEHECAPRLPE